MFAAFPFDEEMIASILDRRLSQGADGGVDSNLLDNLHRSIQLLPNPHRTRSTYLATVGDFYIKQFQQSQCQEALNKAVEIYGEAMSIAPRNDTQTGTYAERYGIA